MTGFWWCMTPTVWIIGMAIIFDKSKQDYGPSFGGALILFVPLWWALYWAIRMGIG